MIIRSIAMKKGLRHFEDYLVRGDDVLIWNEVVAREYQHVMTFHLGMEISWHKTLVGKDC